VRGSALAARGLSDFARFNRVEGVALGSGVTWRLGQGISFSAKGRYGFEDRVAKWRVDVRRQSAHGTLLGVFADDDYQDAGDVAERSQLVNSLAAQEFGSDYTDLFSARTLGVSAGARLGGLSWTLTAAHERHAALAVHATPANGRFTPPVGADGTRRFIGQLLIERPTALWLGGVEMRARANLRWSSAPLGPDRCASTCRDASVSRAAADVEIERPLGDSRLVSRTIGGIVRASGDLPGQQLVFLGGPASAPGYDYHSLVGDAMLSQRLELRVPVPFPAISLGRFGRSPARITAAPFGSVVGLNAADPATVTMGASPNPQTLRRMFDRRTGIYPSAGLGLLLFFDLLRLDVARGFKDGRWMFYLDANRTFWGVL
jgi:hypothetical protein